MPQPDWTAYRDLTFSVSYSRLTLYNDTHALFEQMFAANGTTFDSFVLQQQYPRVPFIKM